MTQVSREMIVVGYYGIFDCKVEPVIAAFTAEKLALLSVSVTWYHERLRYNQIFTSFLVHSPFFSGLG